MKAARAACGFAPAPVLLLAGVLALAGCTGGSDGGGATPTSSGPTGVASTSTSGAESPTAPTTASDPSTSTAPTASGSPSLTASSLPTPTVTIAAGSVAAYAYVEAQTSGSAQLDAVTCGQDGSVVGAQVRLAPGAAALTLVEFEGRGDRTVPGTGAVDAAGGTFHGGDATLAVVFTWTC